MRIRMLLAGAALAIGALVVPVHAASAQPTDEGERCIKLLEQGKAVDDCQKAPNPLLPEKNEIIWGGGAFVIVLFALSKFAYPSIKKGMTDRTERIRESIDEADKAKADAQNVLAEYQRQVADAKTEGNRIIDEARQAAESVRADLMGRAEADAAEARQRARDEIEASKGRAISDLQAQVGDLTIALAEKIVERSIDADTSRALIDSYISNLGSTS